MLSVKSISKSFYNYPCLHQISFQLDRGLSFIILGQSGVGKSVLLKIIAGLMGADEGAISLPTQNIGMLFQKNALFDSLTVAENLNFTLKERTNLNALERQEKINYFLNAVGLANTNELFPESLSGGMQKRLAIARALIVEPEILLCDEPTAGLDPITSRMICDLLNNLRKKMNTTLVVVTSDVMRAYQLADRIGLLIREPQGATLYDAGTCEQARNSTHPAMVQFLTGNANGPLTVNEPISRFQKKNLTGISITEHIDVDWF